MFVLVHPFAAVGGAVSRVVQPTLVTDPIENNLYARPIRTASTDDGSGTNTVMARCVIPLPFATHVKLTLLRLVDVLQDVDSLADVVRVLGLYCG